jgi:hypothetical protein
MGRLTCAVVRKPLRGFAHLICSEIESPKVAHRTTTSIMLLAVLVAGILAPTGMCALMCERHARADIRRHCVSSSAMMSGMDTMPGMAHDHSAVDSPAVEALSLVMVSQACQTSCVTAERLNASKKVVPAGTVVQIAAVVLDPTTEVFLPFTAAWGLDSGPPTPSHARSVSFFILRI